MELLLADDRDVALRPGGDGVQRAERALHAPMAAVVRKVSDRAAAGGGERPARRPGQPRSCRRLGACLGLLLPALPAATGVAAPDPETPAVHWRVTVRPHQPRRLRVTGVLTATSQTRRLLELIFPDLRRFPSHLQSLAAADARGAVAATALSDARWRLDLRDSAGGVKVDYVIDPTYVPPGSGGVTPRLADARSRVGPDLAVLRTWSFLPRLRPPVDRVSVAFDLPRGWRAVTPWPEHGDAFVLPHGQQDGVEYIGLGPFSVREIDLPGSRVRLAVHSQARGPDPETVGRLLHHLADRFGPPPSVASDTRLVVVVPAAFMAGGAAGRHSVVQPPDPVVLSHELVHWWNGADLTAPDAAWFREGFTNYWGLQAARHAGLATAAETTACLADLAAEMRHLERRRGLALGRASRAAGHDPAMRRLVYSKGTLLALLMDRLLPAPGVDAVLVEILRGAGRDLGNSDLRRFFRRHPEVDVLFREHVLRPRRLPPVELGPASGRSGCARFLPPAGEPQPGTGR